MSGAAYISHQGASNLSNLIPRQGTLYREVTIIVGIVDLNCHRVNRATHATHTKKVQEKS